MRRFLRRRRRSRPLRMAQRYAFFPTRPRPPCGFSLRRAHIRPRKPLFASFFVHFPTADKTPACSFIPHPMADKTPACGFIPHPMADKTPACGFIPHTLADKTPACSFIPHPMADKNPACGFIPHPMADKNPACGFIPHTLADKNARENRLHRAHPRRRHRPVASSPLGRRERTYFCLRGTQTDRFCLKMPAKHQKTPTPLAQ